MYVAFFMIFSLALKADEPVTAWLAFGLGCMHAISGLLDWLASKSEDTELVEAK